MKLNFSRRGVLKTMAGSVAGIFALKAAKPAKGAVQKFLVNSSAPPGYDPTKHRWQIALDAGKCIGCGLCAEACKEENNVPKEPRYFRTWIERYIITKPKSGSGDMRGEVFVDSPNGGIGGFPKTLIPKEEILKAFFVPKLCNQCEKSPCSQVCPVGATFESPDGAVLVDPNYCIGCGFCVQACPYGCRFLNPNTHTADKCSLCYHRITRGLKPACVEICPAEARIFGDLKNSSPDDTIQKFVLNNKAQSLKPHLGTEPRVLYADLDKEVR
jgi:Fe-S-cluster-containing dehydrogenase component